jgi:uncharacterized membrane protein
MAPVFWLVTIVTVLSATLSAGNPIINIIIQIILAVVPLAMYRLYSDRVEQMVIELE